MESFTDLSCATKLSSWFIKRSIGLETGRWLLISQQKALTSEETQKHLWCRCKFPISEPILTWDLLTTTYPNNRAVSGNLCNSRWNQRRSSQASGCTPRPLWLHATKLHPLQATVHTETLTMWNMSPTSFHCFWWANLNPETAVLINTVGVTDGGGRSSYWKASTSWQVLSCK